MFRLVVNSGIMQNETKTKERMNRKEFGIIVRWNHFQWLGVQQHEWIYLIGWWSKPRKKWIKIKSKIIVGGNKKKFHLEKLMLFIRFILAGVRVSCGMGSASFCFIFLLLLNNIRKQSTKISYSLHAPLKVRGEVSTQNASAKGINSKVLSVSRKSHVEKLIKNVFFFFCRDHRMMSFIVRICTIQVIFWFVFVGCLCVQTA